MSSAKIHTIILGLILIQGVWAKPFNDIDNFLDSSENRTLLEKILPYTFFKILLLKLDVTADAVNVSRYILKDQDVVADTKPEVVEFKRNLTTFVEMYDTENENSTWEIIDIYSDTTDYYLELDQEQVTPESAFIIGILNKYNANNVKVKYETGIRSFMDSFSKIVEKNKAHFKKPLLDWYEKYSKLEDLEGKVQAFGNFIELIKAQ